MVRTAARARRGSSAMVSAMKASALRTSRFEGSEDHFREVSEIAGYDDGGLGLERCGHDMGVVGVRQALAGVQHGVEALDNRFFERLFHIAPRALGPMTGFLDAFGGQDVSYGRLGLVEDLR